MAGDLQNPNYINKILPVLKWKGEEHSHYEYADASWEIRYGRRRFPFVNGTAHRPIGRSEFVLPIRLFFLNSLEKNMFPDKWETWKPLLTDGEAGPLTHPLLGDVDAVICKVDVQLRAQSTAGVVVECTWEDTVLDPEAAIEIDVLVANMDALATELDVALEAMGIDYPTGQSTSSLKELIGQIQGLLFSARLRALGLLNQALGIIDQLITTVSMVQDHSRYPVVVNLTTLYGSILNRVEKLGALERPTGIVQVANDTTLAAIAKEKGNSLGDIMGLNPGLLSKPVVKKGSSVAFYV